MKAIIFWINATGSISAAEMSRQLSISYPSSWKMLMKMRQELHKHLDTSLLTHVVEADEAWFGRKDNQEIILGLVERKKRKLILESIPNVQEDTLYPIVEKNVEKGSNFYTDSRITYCIAGLFYNHKATNHSKGEFARNSYNECIHSNTIEQIWGDIKGIIRTIHHGISKKYRKYYLAQYIFKYENIKSTNLFYLTLFKLFSPTYCLY